ncbi:MAG TPA: SGNH/GDSL hydrolase family protein [Nitrospina sp.]|nr:SGNH/GDSL hydrolase family protein [Nitrospina sp.]
MITYFKKIFFASIILLFFFGSIEFLLRSLNIGDFIFDEFVAMRALDAPLLIKDRFAGVKMAPNGIYADPSLKNVFSNLRPNFLPSDINPKAGFVRLNSLGFRDQELNKDATYKILCLGDSTTFGWGLYSNDLIFTKKLENKLTEFLKWSGSAKTVDIFNAGTPSYSVYQGLQIYLHYLVDLTHWDYIILWFGLNKSLMEKNLIHIREELLINKFLYDLRDFLRKFRTYNILKTYLQKLVNPEITRNNAYEKIYEKLIKIAKEQGSKIIILPLVIPNTTKSRNAYGYVPTLNQITKKVSKKTSSVYLKIDEDFDKHKGEIKWFDSVHFDSTGHTVIANKLFDFLKDDLN